MPQFWLSRLGHVQQDHQIPFSPSPPFFSRRFFHQISGHKINPMNPPPIAPMSRVSNTPSKIPTVTFLSSFRSSGLFPVRSGSGKTRLSSAVGCRTVQTVDDSLAQSVGNLLFRPIFLRSGNYLDLESISEFSEFSCMRTRGCFPCGFQFLQKIPQHPFDGLKQNIEEREA